MIDNGEIDRVLANLAEKGMAYEKDGATGYLRLNSVTIKTEC